MWTKNVQMSKLGLEKEEEPEIKLPTITGSLKKQEHLINWINDRESNLKSKNAILNVSSHRPRENSNCSFIFLICGYPCDYISEIWDTINMVFISAVQVLSHMWLFAASWTVARQASLSITNSQSLLKLMPIESVMPSNHLILHCPLLLMPSVFPSISLIGSDLIG